MKVAGGTFLEEGLEFSREYGCGGSEFKVARASWVCPVWFHRGLGSDILKPASIVRFLQLLPLFHLKYLLSKGGSLLWQLLDC